MKQLLLITFVILCLNINAQTLQPLENNKTKLDLITTSIIDTQLYYLHTETLLDTFKNAINTKHSIVKYTLNNFTKETKPVNLNTNNISYISHFIKMHKDTIYVFALIAYQPTLPFFNYNNTYALVLLKFNKNLDLISTIPIIGNEFIYSGDNTWHFLTDSTIVFSKLTNLANLQSEYQEINIYSGSILQTYSNGTNIELARQWYDINDSTVACIKDADTLRYFDRNLTYIKSRKLLVPNSTSLLHVGYAEVKFNGNIILNALVDTSLNFNAKYSCILSCNPVNDSCKIIYKEFVGNPAINWGALTDDMLNNQYFFNCNTYKDCDPFDLDNQFYCTNQLEINKIDTNGNLLWKKIVGNDAAYYTQEIIATPDSGCLVFATRYDSSMNHNENDTYYIKLDKDGNQQTNYLPTEIKDLSTANLSLLLYPNPASTIIKLDGIQSPKEIKYAVFSQDGKVVQKGSYKQAGIEISNLSTGFYIIQVTQGSISKSFRLNKQ
jgi:hypothetical protein